MCIDQGPRVKGLGPLGPLATHIKPYIKIYTLFSIWITRNIAWCVGVEGYVKTLSGHKGHRVDSPRLHKILHNIKHYCPLRSWHVAASHWLTLPCVNKPLDHLSICDWTTYVAQSVVRSIHVAPWGVDTSHVQSFHVSLYRHNMCPFYPFDFILWPWLTWTLTANNFCVRAMFDESFALLEIWQWALRNDVIFKTIWDGLILRIYGPLGTSVSVPGPLRPLWAFLRSS